MATWRQAIDNVIAGNVALSDNHRFTFAPYHSSYQTFYFDALPSIVCEIDLREGIGTENKIVFKDGSYYGFYLDGYSGNQIDVKTFAKIENYPIIGNTPSGTEYSWLNGSTVLNHIEIQVATQTIRCDVQKIAMSFICNPSTDNVIQTVYFATFADNLQYGAMWTWDYFSNNPTADHGEMGYLQEQSHVVDFLAGDESAPPDYPGDPGSATGGNGRFYADNDGVPFSRAPRLQLIDLGFNTIYNPSREQMRSIAEWLWSDDFGDNIHLNYVDPFNNIVMIAACPIRESNLSKVTAPFKIGNTYMHIGQEYFNLNKINDQYVELYCGTRTIEGYWNNFLDYEATYTLYLPFVGFRSLKTDDIVNSDITIKYIIDVLTGHATAEVGCVPFNPDSGERGKLSVLYSFPCNIYYNMAFSGANFISQYSQQLSATSSGINNAVSAAGQMASGNLLGAVAGIANLLTGSAQAKMQYDTAKPDYGRGGNNSGNIGLFSCRYPYIVRSLPLTQSANNYNQLRGVPLQLDYQLSDLTGYTEIEAVVVDTLSNCTTDEKNAIVDMLKSGVYL